MIMGSFPPFVSPQLSGCILFAPPNRTCHIIHNDLLCNVTCTVTGSALRTGGGGGGTNGKDPGRVWSRNEIEVIHMRKLVLAIFSVRTSHFGPTNFVYVLYAPTSTMRQTQNIFKYLLKRPQKEL